jgi:hypothetical protein
MRNGESLLAPATVRRLPSEPNKSFVFQFPGTQRGSGHSRSEVGRKFANSCSEVGFTSTTEKDPDTFIDL